MVEQPGSFEALVVTKANDEVVADITRLEQEDLPGEEVLIRVRFSGVNYKDALAVTNRGRIVRSFPMVPGIDLAGEVAVSDHSEFSVGDHVLITGYGTGEDHWGGYSEFARARPEWIVPVPKALSLREAMALGTAGFTAMLSIMALEEKGLPPGGEVLVTGATGGVGSFSVALLSAAGYRVVASTGRPEHSDYLRRLGAAEVISRDEASEAPAGALSSERWSGAIDSVGGATLASILAATRRDGSVAACGLAGGHELHTTVFPFILRGANLLGIDSNYCPAGRRSKAWERLASDMPEDLPDTVVDSEVPLAGIPGACEDLLSGRVRGRVLVRLAG